MQAPSSNGDAATPPVTTLLYIVSPTCSELFIGLEKVISIESGIFLFYYCTSPYFIVPNFILTVSDDPIFAGKVPAQLNPILDAPLAG